MSVNKGNCCPPSLDCCQGLIFTNGQLSIYPNGNTVDLTSLSNTNNIMTYLTDVSLAEDSNILSITYTGEDGVPQTKNVFLPFGDLEAIEYTGTTPILVNNSSRVISIIQSSATTSGYLSSTDWSYFDQKLDPEDVTADNGLTYALTSGVVNIQLGAATALGSPLLNDRYINNGVHTLFFNGANSGSDYIIKLNNTGTGFGLNSTVIDTTAVEGVTTGGVGVGGFATGTGTGVAGAAVSGYGGQFSVDHSSTNTVRTVVHLSRGSTGTPSSGIGARIEFAVDLVGGGLSTHRLNSIATDPNNATVTSQFEIENHNSGQTWQRVFALTGPGQLILDKYGLGTFTGTLTKFLAVTATGSVIETDAASNDITITADNGLTKNTATNVQLGGTLLHNTVIDTTVNYSLTVSGNVPGATQDGTLIVQNNASTGVAVYGKSTGHIAGFFDGTNYGVYARSTNAGASGVRGEASGAQGFGVLGYVSTTTGTAIQGLSSTTDASAILPILKLTRAITGTPSNGIGGKITFSNQTTGVGQISAEIASTWTDVNSATRTGDLQFWTTETAVTTKKVTIYGNGDVEIHTVGKGIIIPSPDGTRYRLQPANGGGSSIWTAV